MNPEGFWNAINLYINKAHTVNKRVWGTKIVLRLNTTFKSNKDISKHKKFDTLEELKSEERILSFLSKVYSLEQCHINVDNIIEVVLLELLPKNYLGNHAYNIICLYKKDMKAVFIDVTPESMEQNLCPNFPYTLLFKENKLILKIDSDIELKHHQWLTDTVIPQLIKWGNDAVNPPTKSVCTQSLSLVPSEKYYVKYNELKIKYGKEMVKIWPECTDPAKFVYEDIAIATYLLLLWEFERLNSNSHKLQSFVDLGCGNGLLVYILANEGHPGLGVDVRKRNIWNMYPDNVKLEEKTITPSDVNLFPQTDWIIGNHSDELTPWIPVVAARSSYHCRFFLLPCCAFNFDGTKYQRKNSSKSQYTEYLEYINSLCIECGFNVDIDRLKIPSTKRICLVGRGRLYSRKEYNLKANNIQNLINCSVKSKELDTTSNWIPDFKARQPVEKVRNCTQLDKILIESIIENITKYLLENVTPSKINLDNNWSPGKSAYIHELVDIVPSELLKKLKTECGGLQTLLKNNHHIFKVQSGKVQFRYPRSVDEINISNITNQKNVIIKKKPCWFFNKHPQGCPLTDEKCSFVHTKNTI